MSIKALLAGFALLAYSTTHVSASSNGMASSSSFSPRADLICPAGQVAKTVGGVTSCYNCLAGSFSANSGSTVCILAAIGNYVPTAGASAQIPCPAGTYSPTTGLIACLDCPAGRYCPGVGSSTTLSCGSGTFSASRASSCTDCPAGTFNNYDGATSCCPCCANFYSSGTGNQDCHKCPSSKPYSNPGTTSSQACVSAPQAYTLQDSCNQASSNTCPASTPVSSPIHRRSIVRKPKCLPGKKVCPLYGSRGSISALAGYDCVDVRNDLESCGGCVDESREGQRSKDGGRDCSAIPHVDSVRCHGGSCIIDSCRRGFVKSADGENCVSIYASLQHQASYFQL